MLILKTIWLTGSDIQMKDQGIWKESQASNLKN